MQKPVELIRRADNEAVEGVLVSGLSGKEVELIERAWTQVRGELLHAVPQAEAFYASCGMTPLATDALKEHLRYSEFSRDAALKFIS